MQGLVTLIMVGCVTAAVITDNTQTTGQPCEIGEGCYNSTVTSVSLINGMAYCCPDTTTVMSSSSFYQDGKSIVECTCDTINVPVNSRNLNSWNTGWLPFNNGMHNLFRTFPFVSFWRK